LGLKREEDNPAWLNKLTSRWTEKLWRRFKLGNKGKQLRSRGEFVKSLRSLGDSEGDGVIKQVVTGKGEREELTREEARQVMMTQEMIRALAGQFEDMNKRERGKGSKVETKTGGRQEAAPPASSPPASSSDKGVSRRGAEAGSGEFGGAGKEREWVVGGMTAGGEEKVVTVAAGTEEEAQAKARREGLFVTGIEEKGAVKWEFRAMDATGQEIRDVVVVPDRERAKGMIKKMGYFPTEVVPVEGWKKAGYSLWTVEVEGKDGHSEEKDVYARNAKEARRMNEQKWWRVKSVKKSSVWGKIRRWLNG
jgi:hypothetical protein